MGTTNISSGNFNELVFENRFRQYGAYVLRKTYSDRLLLASVIGIGTALAIVSIPLILQLFGSPVTPPDAWNTPPIVQDTVMIDNTPEKKIEKKIDIKPKDLSSQPPKGDDLHVKITEERDTIKDDRSLVQEDFKHGRKDGTEDTASTGTVYVSKPGEGNEGGDLRVEVVEFPTEWPKFQGNLGAWLSSNLRYPAYAKDVGIQGTVYLSFVVDEEGSVNDIRILRDIGGGCGESAVAAVKKMPKWIPGTAYGKPAKVLYKLPVKFTLKN